MLHRFFVVWVALAVLLPSLIIFPNPGISDPKLTILTEDYPPFNYVEDGELKGFAVEVVNRIQDRLGISHSIAVYPWARAYKVLQSRPNVALFSTSRSEVREKLFKWVGPLATVRHGLYGLGERALELKTIDDARTFVIGVDRAGYQFEHLTALGFDTLDPSAYPENNLKKLLNGRNDLWFTNKAVAVEKMRLLGKDIALIDMVLEVSETQSYIAFSKETPDTVVNQWQSAFDDLVADGTVMHIMTKHGLEASYPFPTDQ